MTDKAGTRAFGQDEPVPGYERLIADLQEAARPDRPVPPEFASYVAKIEQHAYTVVDADVEALLAGGHGEDEIFEQTVSAAVRAGLERLQAGLDAL